MRRRSRRHPSSRLNLCKCRAGPSSDADHFQTLLRQRTETRLGGRPAARAK